MASDGSEQAKRESGLRRWLRVDIIIALLALVISAIAALGTWYQTRIVAEQLSSTVWPYLSFTINFNDNRRLEFLVSNDGTGPAIVRGASIRVGTRSYRKLSDVLSALSYHGTTHGKDTLHDSSINYGQVLRSGATITYLAFTDAALARRYAAGNELINATVCYCSILDRCWIVSADADEPASTKDCASFGRHGIATGN